MSRSANDPSRRAELEQRMAEGGADAVERDAELRTWVESDDGALALLEAMVLLDQSFEDMSSNEAADAPDDVVAALLARPELAEPAEPVEPPADAGSAVSVRSWLARLRHGWPSRIGWRLQLGVAAAATVVVTLSLLIYSGQSARDHELMSTSERKAPASSEPGFDAQLSPPTDEFEEQKKDRREELRALGYVGGNAPASPNGLKDVVGGERRNRAREDLANLEAARQKLEKEVGEHRLEELSRPPARKAKSIEVASEVPDATGLLDLDESMKRSGARRFLDERRRTDGLAFREAAGYWRNPWLPGDPELRFLAARMDELAPLLPDGLHHLARRPDLPFDAPEEDALALYLHADRDVADGPARVALRVGVRAADAWAGRRTAMNLAVVLHLPPTSEEIPVETAASLRALLDALAEAHDLGDHFQLLVAGRPGGLVVPADEFRRGAVLVAATTLLESTEGAETAEHGDDLATALARAGRLVGPGAEETGDHDEDDRPVGSSAVLVVTTGSDARALVGVAGPAHRLAVGGVRVSAIGVGADASAGDLPELLARLAEAGQGSRRLVARPADALPAVEDELVQAARAVARAVRLRIRPAPGVRLVGVFDSEPLPAPAADRVREAEQALDRRLAHKLGIEADRGDDEEGIQIVVPALYAGDAMTLLVDLVAPGPGPLADVTVRYKDLVRMDNGVARARLDLAYGEPPEVPEGPLQVSVVKSLLAHEVKDCLETASSQLEATKEATEATATLEACRDLLRGMTTAVPALAGDPDLESDLRMLDRYLSVLSALSANTSANALSAVRQSLHYAGKLKTLPPPEPAHD